MRFFSVHKVHPYTSMDTTMFNFFLLLIIYESGVYCYDYQHFNSN